MSAGGNMHRQLVARLAAGGGEEGRQLGFTRDPVGTHD
jgi:hypothetical protein